MTSILWSAGTGLRILLVLLLVNTGQFLVGGRRQAILCGNLRRNFRPYPNTRVVKSGNQLRVVCDPGYFIRDRGRRPRTQLVIKCNGGGTLQQPIPKCTDYSKCGHAYYTPRPVTTRARVVGGRPSKRSDWPWAVKLVIKDTYWCGGTIVSEEYIMTAAHCLQGVDHEDQIKISFEDKKNTTKIAKAYVIHPNYNNDLLKNDVAMIQYERLRRYNRNQQRICLPQIFNTNRFLTTSMLAIGWGTTKPVAKGFRGRKKDRSDQIKQVAIPLIDNRACAKNVQDKLDLGLQNWYFNSTKQFCAGDISGQNDTCHGDSGGPAMVYNREDKSWIQVGIISWGYGCAQKGEYGYYTKVSAFLDWIEKVIHIPTFKRVVRPPKKDPQCPSLRLQHGKIVSTGRRFNDTAKFLCDTTYILFGSSKRRCLANGKWDGVPAICSRACKDPGIKKNSQRLHSPSFPVNVGQKLIYYCDVYYRTNDPVNITCLRNGKWSSETPTCTEPLVFDYTSCGHAYYKPPLVNRRARIVGGEESVREDWPWAVKLLRQREGKDITLGGGTIINKEFILTAAHGLLHVNNPAQIKISFEDKRKTIKTAKKFFVHPDYNPTTNFNDIALVQFEKITRYTRYQQRICLPQKINAKNLKKNSVFVVGWGTTKPVAIGNSVQRKDISRRLKQVEIPLINNKACAKYVQDKINNGFKNWEFNSTTQFCAADMTGTNDTCSGDGGGPAMVYNSKDNNWILYGVLSWGYGCAQREYGFFTKVSAFSEWIEKIIQNA